MKRILSILLLQLYLTLGWGDKPGGVAAIIWALRDWEAKVASITPGKVLWVGDSRIHGFEKQINDMGHVCLAVSGAKVRNLFRKVREYADLIHASAIVIGIGGNNVRNDEHLQDICDERDVLAEELKGYRVFWIEVTPLGILDTKAPERNAKIYTYNNYCEKAPNTTIVHVNQTLAPQGFLDPEYGSGDQIHFNEKAWPVCRDQVCNALKEAGIS